jgi:hypothetical protein
MLLKKKRGAKAAPKLKHWKGKKAARQRKHYGERKDAYSRLQSLQLQKVLLMRM